MEQQSPVGRIWQWGEAEHGRLITAVVLAVLGTVCGMVPYFAAAKIITLLLAGEQALNAYTPWLLTALCGYLLCTVLYNSALSISHKATYNILKTIRQMLLAKLPKLPLGTVMDTSSGKLKQTIVDQVDGMETTLAHLFPEMTANIAAPVLTIVYLFVLDWRLALLSLVVFPVAFFFMMTVMGGYGKDYAGAVQATNEMSSTLIEYINGIEVIKAFNQGEKSYARLTEKVRYNAQYYVNWMKKSQLGMAMAYGFFPAQMLTILPAGWLLWLHGSLSAETFLTVIILALGMAAPIVAAFNFVDTLAQVGTTVGQVDEILCAEEQEHGSTPVTFAGHDIVLQNVSFGYHADKEILHDVSLTIPAGKMTALVGPSGSGKSTLCNLIARFWDVDSGSVKIGGVDVRDYTLESLMDQISMVFQNVYLFADTIENNIKFGCPEATHEQVVAAARKACCVDFIEALPDGYDTVIGEGGASLSGGEKQRISIARAMLKDAPIVILDEATANVDPENEDRLQKAIEALTRDKTIILIAHRLKTVKNADQILVVDHGRIVQQGKHEQLMKQPGLYAEFVGGRRQAEGWKL